MKFEINATDFKKVVDRAMAIMKKESEISIHDCIKIQASGGKILISTVSKSAFVDITTDARVIESGKAYVNKDSLKKIYNSTGCITVESDEKIFNINNGKKCCEIAVINIQKEDEIKSPQIDDNTIHVFDENGKALIDTFISMDCVRSKDEIRPILKGFNINSSDEQIVACDGYRVAIKHMGGKFHNSNVNITIPGDVSVNLKKVGNCKKDEVISVFYGKSQGYKDYYVFFKGNDFTYCSKILAGEYPKTSHILKGNKQYSFELSPRELENIAKEYAQTKNSSMYIIKYEDKLYTSVVTPEYQTADTLVTVNSVDNVNDGFCFCANSLYINQALGLFKDETVLVYGEGRLGDNSGMISPMIFKGNEYTTIVLPMRTSMENIKNRMGFISKLQN